MIGRVNVGGGGDVLSMPVFTYTGAYTAIDDGNNDWRIKFTSSGTLTFTQFGKGKGLIDVFLVGGGNGGQWGSFDATWGTWKRGGGGGYTKTQTYVSTSLTSYEIVVGSGGSQNNGAGGASSAFGFSISGGSNGNGGSGGAGPSYSGGPSVGPGGSDGADGATGNSDYSHGIGQHTTTREFGEATGTLYAGGGGTGAYVGTYSRTLGGEGGGGAGGSGSSAGTAGTANTGGGGGGGTNNPSNGGAGGSGIVIIRNHRS